MKTNQSTYCSPMMSRINNERENRFIAWSAGIIAAIAIVGWIATYTA